MNLKVPSKFASENKVKRHTIRPRRLVWSVVFRGSSGSAVAEMGINLLANQLAENLNFLKEICSNLLQIIPTSRDMVKGIYFFTTSETEAIEELEWVRP